MIKAFRNINSIQLIPDNIYEELNNNGTIDEWNKIFRNYNSNSKKIMTKNEINEYTISVTNNSNLEYDKKELFYAHSNIYRTSYKYEFDKESLKGKGLIMEKGEVNNFF